jgi:hypothetical protein
MISQDLLIFLHLFLSLFSLKTVPFEFQILLDLKGWYYITALHARTKGLKLDMAFVSLVTLETYVDENE